MIQGDASVQLVGGVWRKICRRQFSANDRRFEGLDVGNWPEINGGDKRPKRRIRFSRHGRRPATSGG